MDTDPQTQGREVMRQNTEARGRGTCTRGSPGAQTHLQLDTPRTCTCHMQILPKELVSLAPRCSRNLSLRVSSSEFLFIHFWGCKREQVTFIAISPPLLSDHDLTVTTREAPACAHPRPSGRERDLIL